MKLEQINEQAKESLRKYFKDAYDNKGQGTRKELTYVEMMDMIHNDIKKEEERLEELRMMKHVLEHDAKRICENYLGKEKENRGVHHDTVDQMQAKLNENIASQLAYANELKQETMNK